MMDTTRVTDRIAHMPARPLHRIAVVVGAVAVTAVLSSSGAVAQTLTDPNPKPSAPPAATTKSRPAAHVKNCAIYGPGFMAMPGSDTCIKIGGGVTVEGTSRR
jgi:Porin subfamily